MHAPQAIEPESPHASRLHFVPILLVALLLRAAMALLMISKGTNLWFYNQASELGCLAQSIDNGHGFASPFCGATGPSAFLAPGYPVLVALAFRVFGEYTVGATAMIIAFQILLGLFIVSSTMVLTRRVIDARSATVAGTLCAVSPTLVWLPVLFWETSFTIFSLIAAITLCLKCVQDPKLWNWVGLGLLCAFAMLVNPALMFTFAAILAWAAYQVPRAHRRAPLATILVWSSLFAAWPIRNRVVLHAFIPLRSNFGYELWQGNRPGANGEFSPELHLNVNRIERTHYAHVGELTYMHEKATIAIAAINADPLGFAQLTLRRMARFWLGLASKNNSALVIANLSLTSLFAVAGLVLLVRTRPALGFLLAAPFVLFPLPYYLTHADFRFRLVLDPLAIMLSVYAVRTFYSAVRERYPNGSTAQSGTALQTCEHLDRPPLKA